MDNAELLGDLMAGSGPSLTYSYQGPVTKRNKMPRERGQKYDKDLPEAREAKYSWVGFYLPRNLTHYIRRLHRKIMPSEVIKFDHDPHVTVRYGLDVQNPKEIQRVLTQHTAIVRFVGPYIFHNRDKNEDVLVVRIVSNDLRMMNNQLSKVRHHDDYPIYLPHVTLAYLKRQGDKNRAERYKDFDIGISPSRKFILRDLFFSDGDEHTQIGK